MGEYFNERFPPEVVEYMFSFLGADDLLSMARTCEPMSLLCTRSPVLRGTLAVGMYMAVNTRMMERTLRERGRGQDALSETDEWTARFARGSKLFISRVPSYFGTKDEARKYLGRVVDRVVDYYKTRVSTHEWPGPKPAVGRRARFLNALLHRLLREGHYSGIMERLPTWPAVTPSHTLLPLLVRSDDLALYNRLVYRKVPGDHGYNADAARTRIACQHHHYYDHAGMAAKYGSLRILRVFFEDRDHDYASDLIYLKAIWASPHFRECYALCLEYSKRSVMSDMAAFAEAVAVKSVAVLEHLMDVYHVDPTTVNLVRPMFFMPNVWLRTFLCYTKWTHFTPTDLYVHLLSTMDDREPGDVPKTKLRMLEEAAPELQYQGWRLAIRTVKNLNTSYYGFFWKELASCTVQDWAEELIRAERFTVFFDMYGDEVEQVGCINKMLLREFKARNTALLRAGVLSAYVTGVTLLLNRVPNRTSLVQELLEDLEGDRRVFLRFERVLSQLLCHANVDVVRDIPIEILKNLYFTSPDDVRNWLESERTRPTRSAVLSYLTSVLEEHCNTKITLPAPGEQQSVSKRTRHRTQDAVVDLVQVDETSSEEAEASDTDEERTVKRQRTRKPVANE